MKKLAIVLLFAGGFANAQYVVDDIDITENSKEIGKSFVSFDLNNPLEFYRLKCENAKYAQFPGGENAFKEELFKNMKNSVDNEAYSVNGTFDFLFSIDKSGNLASFTLKPEVKNSDILSRDLNSAVKRITKKWSPALCNGEAVASKLRMRVNFRTENYDL